MNTELKSFLISLSNEDNASVMESIMQGYNIIFEESDFIIQQVEADKKKKEKEERKAKGIIDDDEEDDERKKLKARSIEPLPDFDTKKRIGERIKSAYKTASEYKESYKKGRDEALKRKR